MWISTWRMRRGETKESHRARRSLCGRGGLVQGGKNWEFGVSQPGSSISASRFTPSECTSPFGRDLANNNVYLVAQNPQNSTLVAAKCLDWRGTIQSRATRYWFKHPLLPRKSGLNCWNFFIGEVVKCFMAERGNWRRRCYAMTMSY